MVLVEKWPILEVDPFDEDQLIKPSEVVQLHQP